MSVFSNPRHGSSTPAPKMSDEALVNQKPQKTKKDKKKSAKKAASSKEEMIAKREAARLDEIEKFLARVDNPDEWRTLRNPDGSERLVLTDQELSLISRLYQNQLGPEEYNAFEPAVDFFSKDVEPMALPAPTEPKRRFIPSAHEARIINHLVKAFREGKLKRPGYKAPAKPRFYDIWAEEDSAPRRQNHIAAPKIKLPGHSESYNPPGEYLFTAEEEAQWRERQANPDPDIPYNPDDFLPQKYKALRMVPAYKNAVMERFARCLDLYLCPRAIKNKLNIDPESLLPELPNPADLKPFPVMKSINYTTTSDAPVGALSFDSTGNYFASCQGMQVDLWHVQTGKALFTWTFDDAVTCVAWNPVRNMPILAITHGSYVSLVIPPVKSFPGVEAAIETLARGRGSEGSSDAWNRISAEHMRILLTGPAKQVCWHRKGDYFATLAVPPTNDTSARSVVIHHLSRHASQHPFKRLPSMPIHLAFHPIRPLLLLVSPAGAVRLYNLQNGALEKKLKPDSHSLAATLAIHPTGDHVLMAGTEGRVTWFDLDLASRPFQTLTGHSQAVRSVAFHPRLPLFASSSVDGSVQISHGQVFQDSLQNPVIVPVKILQGHSNRRDGKVAVSQCVFHPQQPWILTATVDGSISLFI